MNQSSTSPAPAYPPHASAPLPAVPGTPASPRRTAFVTNIGMDFFNRRGLTVATGHEEADWPLVLVKELVDNALDACEEAGVEPNLSFRVDGDVITVSDNGPGLPPEVVDHVVDFTVRVSSREALVAPARGAQGNGLKLCLAMPYALSTDGTAEVVMDACGVKHVITIGVDHIRQAPKIHHRRESGFVKTGTCVQVRWPDSPSSMPGARTPRILQIFRDLTLLNPHLESHLDWNGARSLYVRCVRGWAKWTPAQPTPPQWYSIDRFERLIAASVARDQDDGTDRTLRAFVSDFGGLSGTAAARDVLEAVDASRLKLSELVKEGRVDPERSIPLLKAMKAKARPPKPAALGVIGIDHLRMRFDLFRIEPKTFQYRRAQGTHDDVPYVIEVAFAVLVGGIEPSDEEGRVLRQLVTGLNFGACLGSPFRELGTDERSAEEILEENRAGYFEPVAVLIHVVMPGMSFCDRGKSVVVLPDPVGDALAELLVAVTAKWKKLRKAEDREASRRQRRRQTLLRERDVSIKAAAYAVLPAAYAKASAGLGIALARQVMYAARGPIQEATGKTLDDRYFTQTLLPDFILDHPELTAGWDVVYDSRGDLHEPHTGESLPLGTREVREHLAAVGVHEPGPLVPSLGSPLYPTRGPGRRYGAILFIEKEGFNALLAAARIAERYDVAIMSTKGVSTTAARRLVDRLCAENARDGVPLLVVHDFDKAGFSILQTLRSDTRRYQFDHAVKVIDLGLRLADVRAWALEGEDVYYGSKDPRPGLAESGATEEETDYLCDPEDDDPYHGRRVELNAFAAADLIRWLEAKFAEHGVRKVVPEAQTLAAAYARATESLLVEQQLVPVMAACREQALATPAPADLRERVESILAADPTKPWDLAVAEIVERSPAGGAA